jgi:hypothetical protein
MEVKTGTVVVVEEMIETGGGKGPGHRNLRFGLVLSAKPPEYDSQRYQLFEIRTADDKTESVKRENMFPVAQLPERIIDRHKNIRVSHISLKEALNIAMPEIVLTVLSVIRDQTESLVVRENICRKHHP